MPDQENYSPADPNQSASPQQDSSAPSSPPAPPQVQPTQPQMGLPPYDSTRDAAINAASAIDKLHTTVQGARQALPDNINIDQPMQMLKNSLGNISKIGNEIEGMDFDVADATAPEKAMLDKTREIRDQKEQDLKEIENQISSKQLDPSRYWHNQNIFQQLSSALAVGLGSYGAAITHSPNFAKDIIDKAADMDWEAQKADYNKLFQLHDMMAKGVDRMDDREKVALSQLTSSERLALEMKQQKLAAVEAGLRVDASKRENVAQQQNLLKAANDVQTERYKLSTQTENLDREWARDYMNYDLQAKKLQFGQKLSPRLEVSMENYPATLKGIDDLIGGLQKGSYNTYPLQKIPGVSTFVKPFSTTDPTYEARNRTAIALARSQGAQISESAGAHVGDTMLFPMSSTKEEALSSLQKARQRLIEDFKTKLQQTEVYQHVNTRPELYKDFFKGQQAPPDRAAIEAELKRRGLK